MIQIGILGGADIAFRMFLPALQNISGVRCAVVASRQADRRARFEEHFGVSTVCSYEDILENPAIDAVYIPLPPALHAEWAKKALLAGKHVLLEKPATTRYLDTKHLVELAFEAGLALQENYMFQYHAQLPTIRRLLAEGIVGDLRLLRSSFGFPLRELNDFRYSEALGGGALSDAGGYVAKLATLLLGERTTVQAAAFATIDGYEVDMLGSATFQNEDGLVLQGAFGMDCHYQCSLEVWGSKGKLSTNRIFTAPAGFTPTATLETTGGIRQIELPSDTHFQNSIAAFLDATTHLQKREPMAAALLLQAKLIEEIKEKANHDSF